MKKNNSFHLILLFILSGGIYANPRITLFFKPELLLNSEKIKQKLKKPGKLAKYTAKGILETPFIEGIMAAYGGSVAASDYNGQLSFVRRHQKEALDIIITPEIVPVPLFESTILQWKRIPGLPVKMYTCEKVYETTKDRYYWQTSEIPVVEDIVIPLSAMIIIAKPKNISMEVGKTMTSKTGNLVLPDIYVKKGINIVENSLYMLLIRHLFKPIRTEENRESLKTITHIID